MDTKGIRGARLDGLGDWDWHIYLTVYKKKINENQLCSTGQSIQCSVVTEMGRKSKKEGMHILPI